ncbi:MAG: acyl-CoA dehydrogenase family protein [Alphaproteobacteria bacterium]|nr:acyl-CoA dehydrogenase family protein [Alphaproteobacteria bacterium]
MRQPDGVLDAARGLGPEIEAAAPEIDRRRRLTPGLLDALHEHKLFRMLLPKPYGGLETPPPLFFRTISEVARHDGSTAWCLCQANGCAMAAAYLAPEIAEEMWGNDPAAVLAWGPGPAEARETETGYRIDAKIAFASGARHATWLGAHMPVVDAGGARQRMADGSTLVRTFLMPASSIEIEDIWDTIGLRGTASDGYTLKDRFVPEAYTTVRDHEDWRQYEAPLYLFLSMNMYAMGFAGTALGIAEGVLDAFLALAQDKTPRLHKSRLADNELVHYDTAQAVARIRSARAFVLSEVEDIWDGAQNAERLDIADRVRIRLASTFAIHEAKTAADMLYDAAGASAIFAGADFERRFRDLHSVTQQLQGRKSHFRTVGAFLMGHPADVSVV